MWTIVLFDLPTETKRQRRNYSLFRKALLKAGFTRFQFSVYIRHALSRDHMLVHHRKVKAILPPQGKISILQMTDKQFGMIQVFEGDKTTDAPEPTDQLYMFDVEATAPALVTEQITTGQPCVIGKVTAEASDEEEELPLGSLLAAAADEKHLLQPPEQDKRKRITKKKPPEDGQLFIF
jgi:CRISPR-associated protein Cas2